MITGKIISLEEKIKRIRGPILVLGASGFIGANLLKTLLQYRQDVYGTVFHRPAWRLEEIPLNKVLQIDLLVDANLDSLFENWDPKVIFNCVSYGSYYFERNSDAIYQTNFILTAKILGRLAKRETVCYVHSGSSTEYGDQNAVPLQDELPDLNSEYAVSKVATANLIHFFGHKKNLPCANLRLHTVFGPLEDASMLISRVVRMGEARQYPDLPAPEITYDLVYVDDVCEAFIDTALNLRPPHYGESFNIGSGPKTSVREIAVTAAEIFSIPTQPVFGELTNQSWERNQGLADIGQTFEILGWKAKVQFREGLRRTAEWFRALEDKEKYDLSSKKNGLDAQRSITAIVACYKDEKAIPIMYERLKNVFTKLNIDYEMIFINDNSPDNSEAVIVELSRRDRRIQGISHTRNFGTQAGFRSGMEIATKNACVLLDGDLQDPPELIELFVEKWREGYEVVYGRRVKRNAPFYMQLAYKLFYWLFNKFSYFYIPRDAGDFSLIDRKVVQAILQFPERDFFLRGVRAFVGFKQIGVDYVRPERMFGVTTNNLWNNIEWAKKGMLSFSYTPLKLLSMWSALLFLLSLLLAFLQIISRLFFPELSPRGITTVLLVILFFGSINLFAQAVIGEYIAKIFEEVKRRPHFLRRSMIKNGEIRSTSIDLVEKED